MALTDCRGALNLVPDQCETCAREASPTMPRDESERIVWIQPDLMRRDGQWLCNSWVAK
jgi:hypothetical protein